MHKVHHSLEIAWFFCTFGDHKASGSHGKNSFSPGYSGDGKGWFIRQKSAKQTRLDSPLWFRSVRVWDVSSGLSFRSFVCTAYSFASSKLLALLAHLSALICSLARSFHLMSQNQAVLNHSAVACVKASRMGGKLLLGEFMTWESLRDGLGLKQKLLLCEGLKVRWWQRRRVIDRVFVILKKWKDVLVIIILIIIIIISIILIFIINYCFTSYFRRGLKPQMKKKTSTEEDDRAWRKWRRRRRKS